MKRSLPDVFKKTDLCKKYDGLILFLEEENNFNLYRIEFDNATGKYIPFPITSLPSLHYNHIGKQKHIISFLEDRYIHNILDKNDNIIIFDPQVEEYKIVTAPVYAYNDANSIYYKKGVHTDKLPTQKMGEAAYSLFEKWHKKIKTEEVLFDFMQLTMDNGKSAYFENYPRGNLGYFDKNKFWYFNVEFNPNHSDTPYNEYTNFCMADFGKDTSYNGSFFVVFNKEEIAKEAMSKYNVNGEVNIILPSKIASIVIGKAGKNIKNITYWLGIRRLNVNPDSLKNVI